MNWIYPFMFQNNFLLVSQSLEGVDDSGLSAEGEANKDRKTPDTDLNIAPDADEDEGVEEEKEECWGMFEIIVHD